jgi:hypothetical protein
MRSTLKAIAVAQAAFGGFLVLGGSLLFVLSVLKPANISIGLLLDVFIVILGAVILKTADRHVRTPTKASARDIAVSASILTWLFIAAPVQKFIQSKPAIFAPAGELVPVLITLGIPFLLYRYVLKRMAETAFPDVNDTGQPWEASLGKHLVR